MTLTAVLFVGGLSRRMGADKATLDFAGEPLWARQLRVLRELNPDLLQLSARERPAWCPPDVGVVLDEPPSRGPLSGLTAALARARTSHVLALAIDLPEMTAEHLSRLQATAEIAGGCVPRRGERFEPLCAVYPAAAVKIAGGVLAGRDWSLQHFVQRLTREGVVQPYPVAPDEKFLYRNVNTPEDLAKRDG